MQGSLHHVEIYVSRLDRSRDFWHWLLVEELGYERIQEWDQGVSFKLGDTYIVFVQTEAAYLDGGYHRKRTGLNHLAFHGGLPENVDRLRKLINERGMKELYADRYPYAGGPDYYALFFEDPDRIKVELVADLSAAAGKN